MGCDSTCQSRSASPPAAPPVVSSTSTWSMLEARALVRMAGSSGSQPRSMASNPRLRASASRVGRLLSWIWPAANGCPLWTSSLPVEKTPTFSGPNTGRSTMPCEAATPRSMGERIRPAGRAVWPVRMSSPRRRTFWPGFWPAGRVIVSDGQAPPSGWLLAPCRAESSAWRRTCSCITTVSAPAGMGAPVMMRQACPGGRVAGGSPASVRPPTGSVVSPSGFRSA